MKTIEIVTHDVNEAHVNANSCHLAGRSRSTAVMVALAAPLPRSSRT